MKSGPRGSQGFDIACMLRSDAANQSRFRSDRRGGCLWARGLAPPSPARRFKLLSSTSNQALSNNNSCPVSHIGSRSALRLRINARWTRSRTSRRASCRIPHAPNPTPDKPVEIIWRRWLTPTLQLAGWAGCPLCVAHLSVHQGAIGPGRGQGSRYLGGARLRHRMGGG